MSVELKRICKRLEELADYSETKTAAAKEQAKTGMSKGQRRSIDIQKRRDDMQRIHDEEADELRKDQEQRNAQPEEADAGAESAEAQ